MRRMLALLITVTVLAAGFLALLVLSQTQMLFPRSLVGPAPTLPAATVALRIDLDDEVVLHGHQFPGRDPSAPALLGFGGNATNAAAFGLMLHQIAPEQDVIVFHYRGYSPSTGQPSAQALLSDAERIFDEIGRDVIVVGASLGSGLAAHLAATRPIRGAVLITPFDSLSAVASTSFPAPLVRAFFRHEINARAALVQSLAPVRAIIASRDEVIAPARARALLDGLATASATEIDAGHNSIYAHPDFVATLRRAISELGNPGMAR